ncbi:DUF2141 domain-containing protein [Maricaulis sp.]|uniref:DUF2141 domain-containing protein n=1 Tax=Maricaulis sp. TaxID=1486257 RepID=UPI0025C0DA57|nr:DUF2141 domain-containing protein [Maricaulis sp.]
MMMTALILAASLGTAPAEAASLIVHVEGLPEARGAVMMAVFASSESWDDGDPVAGSRVAVRSDAVTVSFDALPAGAYAIRMYHDVDGDGELDVNLMGIPSEPFAFSNNARGRFGPASWADAVFQLVPGENTHTLNVQ